MRIAYIDDQANYREEVEASVAKLREFTGRSIDFDFVQPPAPSQFLRDPLYLDEDGLYIPSVPSIPPRQVLSKSTIDSLASDSSCIFLVDVHFGELLTDYGERVAKYLLRSGIPVGRIVLFSLYPSSARSDAWIDRYDKADFGTPFNSERLALRLVGIIGRLKDGVARHHSHAESMGTVGNSQSWRAAVDMAGMVAGSLIPVHLFGETGTGKERLAELIHRNSDRAKRRMTVINIAQSSPHLVEDDLFGHVPNAFTGAGSKARQGALKKSHNSTLFLDEIGDLAPELQVKLLRVLEIGSFQALGSEREEAADFRLITATHRNVEDLVLAQKFRKDLWYRIRGVKICLPPLRERKEDIPLLAESLLEEIAKREGRGPKSISSEGLEKLACHEWPGNVRELRHCLHQAYVLTQGETISASSLVVHGDSKPKPTAPAFSWADARSRISQLLSSRRGTPFKNFRDMLHALLEGATLGEQPFRVALRHLIMEAVNALGKEPSAALRDRDLLEVIALLGEHNSQPGWLRAGDVSQDVWRRAIDSPVAKRIIESWGAMKLGARRRLRDGDQIASSESRLAVFRDLVKEL